jgi:hypothetical protein
MVGIVVVTRAALLIARRASTWTLDEHLAFCHSCWRTRRHLRRQQPRPLQIR